MNKPYVQMYYTICVNHALFEEIYMGYLTIFFTQIPDLTKKNAMRHLTISMP